MDGTHSRGSRNESCGGILYIHNSVLIHGPVPYLDPLLNLEGEPRPVSLERHNSEKRGRTPGGLPYPRVWKGIVVVESPSYVPVPNHSGK